MRRSEDALEDEPDPEEEAISTGGGSRRRPSPFVTLRHGVIIRSVTEPTDGL